MSDNNNNDRQYNAFNAGDINVNNQIINPNDYNAAKSPLVIKATRCANGRVELELNSSDNRTHKLYQMKQGQSDCIVSSLKDGSASFSKLKIGKLEGDGKGKNFSHILFYIVARIFDNEKRLVEIQQSSPFLMVAKMKVKKGGQSYDHHKAVLDSAKKQLELNSKSCLQSKVANAARYTPQSLELLTSGKDFTQANAAGAEVRDLFNELFNANPLPPEFPSIEQTDAIEKGSNVHPWTIDDQKPTYSYENENPEVESQYQEQSQSPPPAKRQKHDTSSEPAIDSFNCNSFFSFN